MSNNLKMYCNENKIFLLLTAGLFCCLSCSKEFENPQNDLGPALKSGVAGVGTIVTETVHSSALEGNLAELPADRNVKIYLPIMPQEDALWGEYGVPAGSVPYYPMNPVYKFANGTAYALAQAWLPNPDNLPYLCDLPFENIEGQPVMIRVV